MLSSLLCVTHYLQFETLLQVNVCESKKPNLKLKLADHKTGNGHYNIEYATVGDKKNHRPATSLQFLGIEKIKPAP